MLPLPHITDAAADGFVLGAGLIVAIGAQNLYVLRQGLKRRFVFTVALACGAIDAALIVAGVGGVGTLIAGNETLTRAAAWGGALFLFVYGVLALRAAIRPRLATIDPSAGEEGSRRETLAGVLGAVSAFSLLNPHVYLDTVVILGGLGAQYPTNQRAAFAGGATVASFLWFFALAYGARVAAPVFTRPAAQRGLDLFVWVVMWSIASGLVWNEVAA
jgi:L-lysine exporter family protein LysE/ArgO